MRRNSSNGWLRRLVLRGGLTLGLVRGLLVGMREAREGPADPIHTTTHAEPGDVAIKAVILTGVGLLLTLWAIVLLVYPLFSWFRQERSAVVPSPPTAYRAPLVPPEPRLQVDPSADLQDLRKYEDGRLNNYFWADRAHGVVSIPIGEAIRIVARRGIPPQPAPPGTTYYDPQAGTRQTGFEGKVEPEPK